MTIAWLHFVLNMGCRSHYIVPAVTLKRASKCDSRGLLLISLALVGPSPVLFGAWRVAVFGNVWISRLPEVDRQTPLRLLGVRNSGAV